MEPTAKLSKLIKVFVFQTKCLANMQSIKLFPCTFFSKEKHFLPEPCFWEHDCQKLSCDFVVKFLKFHLLICFKCLETSLWQQKVHITQSFYLLMLPYLLQRLVLPLIMKKNKKILPNFVTFKELQEKLQLKDIPAQALRLEIF